MDKLIEENINYVYALSNYFKNYNNREDIFQAGCIGLLKAYNSYDPNYNTKFTTYAYPFIMGEMRRFIREDKSIHINRDIVKFNMKIIEVYNKLEQKLGRYPKTSEVAEFLGVDELIVIESLNSLNPVESLDDKVADDLSLYEVIGKNYNYDDNIDLNSELDKLNPFEKELIDKRYRDDLTQSEVAKFLGISQVQVSRNETKILKKIRTSLNNI